jgi:glycerophosphoryl diester phosphodiesterase
MPLGPGFYSSCALQSSTLRSELSGNSPRIQGVVAEAVPHVLKRLKDVVDQFHRAGLFFFTFGDANNAMEHYSAQRAAGVDAIILDDTARLAKVHLFWHECLSWLQHAHCWKSPGSAM